MGPGSMCPNALGASLALRDSRNHNTSIRAPRSSALKPAQRRSVEWRPSQATTRSARMSQFSVQRLCAQARNAAVLLHEIGRLGAQAKIEIGEAPAPLRQEIEKIPLRHQCDEFAMRRQMPEVADRDPRFADLPAQSLHARMRQLEEGIEQPELMHQFEGRRVDGVAAEIAQEIGMLLEHGDANAGTREQKAEHHAARSPPGDE